MLKRSTALANAVMVTGSLRSLITGGFLYFFSGPVPDTADEAIDGAAALVGKVTESGDGTTGLTFESVATNGVLVKETTEQWKTTYVATDDITFFRFGVGADDCEGVAHATTGHRLQGTVGEDMSFDCMLTNASAVTGEELVLDAFQIQFPPG